MGLLDNLNADFTGGIFNDPRVKRILDNMMQTIRDIIDQFQGILHEIWNVAEMIGDMFRKLVDFIQGQGARLKKAA